MAATKKSPVLKILIGSIAILIALAIVIPNVLRSKISEGGNPGANMLRTINTAEVVYATNFEKIGYAPNLALLGPAGNGECNPEHACLLDAKVSCAKGTGKGWCVAEGYRFNLQSSSTEAPYRDYWATATPARPYPKFNELLLRIRLSNSDGTSCPTFSALYTG